MHVILVLLRKDFANFRRNKAAVSLTFLVPFALIYLFGQVFGVNRSDSGPNGFPLAVINLSSNPAALKLVDALKAEPAFKILTTRINPDKTTRPMTEDDLRPLMRDNQFRFAVVIPKDLISETSLGLNLRIYSNPQNQIESQMVSGILQKTLFSNVPQLLGEALQSRAKSFVGEERLGQFNSAIASAVASTFGGNKDQIKNQIAAGNYGVPTGGPSATPPATNAATTPILPATAANSTATPPSTATSTATPAPAPATTPAPARPDIFSRIVHIENIQVAGKDVKSPAATRIVGGWAMQFLLFALTASAVSLFYERDFGIFHRILAGPVSRSQILWSKFIYGICLGLTQLLVLFLAGRVLYGIDIEHHWGFLILVCAFAAAACTSFGMLLASLVSTPEAASGLSTLIILLMSAIGGAWFPVSFMPEFIQHIAHFTIVYWAMEGFGQVLWLNASFAELLPTLGILAGITALVMTIAVWRFNRGKLFG